MRLSRRYTDELWIHRPRFGGVFVDAPGAHLLLFQLEAQPADFLTPEPGWEKAARKLTIAARDTGKAVALAGKALHSVCATAPTADESKMGQADGR